MTPATFTTERDLVRHYAAVHTRLWPPIPCAESQPVKRRWSTPYLVLVIDTSGQIDTVINTAMHWLAREPSPLTPEHVHGAFLRATGMTVGDFAAGKHHPLVFIRQASMAAAYMLTDASLLEIARQFGRSDHTTARRAHLNMRERVSRMLARHGLEPNPRRTS